MLADSTSGTEGTAEDEAAEQARRQYQQTLTRLKDIVDSGGDSN